MNRWWFLQLWHGSKNKTNSRYWTVFAEKSTCTLHAAMGSRLTWPITVMIRPTLQPLWPVTAMKSWTTLHISAGLVTYLRSLQMPRITPGGWISCFLCGLWPPLSYSTSNSSTAEEHLNNLHIIWENNFFSNLTGFILMAGVENIPLAFVIQLLPRPDISVRQFLSFVLPLQLGETIHINNIDYSKFWSLYWTCKTHPS